jgi:hypothetical protein
MLFGEERAKFQRESLRGYPGPAQPVNSLVRHVF